MMYSRTLKIAGPTTLTGTFGIHAISLECQHQSACETPVLKPRGIKSLPWTIIRVTCWYASEEKLDAKSSSQNENNAVALAPGDAAETISQM